MEILNNFLNNLFNLFSWIELKWKWKYVNLLNKKRIFLRDFLFNELHNYIINLKLNKEEEKEIYNKIYNFFLPYFNEVWFIYDKNHLFSIDNQNLLLIKSEKLFLTKTIKVNNNVNIIFDTSNFEFLENNDRKEINFLLKDINETNDKIYNIILEVKYLENDNIEEIFNLKNLYNQIKLSNKYIKLKESELKKIITSYKSISETHYILNEDINWFFNEKYNYWLINNYINNWILNLKLKEMEIINNITFKIIWKLIEFENLIIKDFVSKKEKKEENIIFTINEIKENKILFNKILNSINFNKQTNEWKELWFYFNIKEDILNNENYLFHIIDTQYFPELKEEIFKYFNNKNNLKWELIKWDNIHWLNLLKENYFNKVKCIYIDPPFNLWTNWDFKYKTNYKNDIWLLMLENRLKIAKDLLTEDWSIFVRCDFNWNYLVRNLLNKIFWEENFKNEIIINKSPKITEKLNKYHNSYDSLFLYSKNKEKSYFNPQTKKREKIKWQPMHLPWIRYSPIKEEYISLYSKENIKEENWKFKTNARIFFWKEFLPPNWRHWALSQEEIFKREKLWTIRINEKWNPESLQNSEQLLTDNWTDIPGYSRTTGFSTENSEALLERVIKTVTKENDIVLDFFLWSGTTIAVAEKLNRRFLGIEVWNQFNNIILPRLKRTISSIEEIKNKKNLHNQVWFFKYIILANYL